MTGSVINAQKPKPFWENDKPVEKNKLSDIEKEKRDLCILFTEMLKNQDPTSQTDHSELVSTMLSFQNTSNLYDIKQYCEDLKNQHNLTNASSLLGTETTYKSSILNLSGDIHKSAEVYYDLPVTVKKVTFEVYGGDGKLITSISDKLPNGKGMQKFIWDGTITDENGLPPTEKGAQKFANNGSYSFSLKAIDMQGNEIKDMSTYVTGTIDNIVKMPNGETVAKFANSNKTVKLSEIKMLGKSLDNFERLLDNINNANNNPQSNASKSTQSKTSDLPTTPYDPKKEMKKDFLPPQTSKDN